MAEINENPTSTTRPPPAQIRNPCSSSKRPAITLLDAINDITDTLERLSKVDAEAAVAAVARSYIPDRIIPRPEQNPLERPIPSPEPLSQKARNQCCAILEHIDAKQAKIVTKELQTLYAPLSPKSEQEPADPTTVLDTCLHALDAVQFKSARTIVAVLSEKYLTSFAPPTQPAT